MSSSRWRREDTGPPTCGLFIAPISNSKKLHTQPLKSLFFEETTMGTRLPSLDKEGMPGSAPGSRQGWLESARDWQSAAFRTTPSSISSRPPLLIRAKFLPAVFDTPTGYAAGTSPDGGLLACLSIRSSLSSLILAPR